MDFSKWAVDNLIVKTLTGSRLYGTHRQDSDYDYRGVCLDPPEALLGIHKFEQQEHVTKRHDEVIYGAAKFLNMVLAANPSILDILFAPKHAIVFQTDVWAEISKNANSLLSQKVRHTFSGYAFSQLKRIKRHKVWIDDPPQRPVLEDYGLFLYSAEGGGQRLELLRPFIQGRPVDKDPIVSVYRQAKSEYDKYMTWRKNRNPARAKLEELYGYDVKHAAHLVRLLLQGENILKAGTYTPELTGMTKVMVLDVLAGEWDYDKLVSFAEEQERLVKTMETDLPRAPDRFVVDDLLRMVAAKSLVTDSAFLKYARLELGYDE